MVKYELIKKEVLQEALQEIYGALLIATNEDNKEIMTRLTNAYHLIQENRTQCNIQPEES